MEDKRLQHTSVRVEIQAKISQLRAFYLDTELREEVKAEATCLLNQKGHFPPTLLGGSLRFSVPSGVTFLCPFA